MTEYEFKQMFPNASVMCRTLNSAVLTQPEKENALQALPNAKKRHHEANHQRKIQDSKLEHHQTPALDSADAGKAKGFQRTVVRFTGYRVRPLDPDNFAGSCKDLLDGLRHAKIIENDEWWRIDFQTRQEKVKSYAEEKTVIEIT